VPEPKVVKTGFILTTLRVLAEPGVDHYAVVLIPRAMNSVCTGNL
jgi:hypothetical protein